ncbi:hypothetical protein HWV62_6915 [Athelia sp. TMB]|nr:hypothetical protein HWV62_6915 [Athelia sp. TMB]
MARGKATRNEAQRRAYHKRTSRKGPSNTAHLPPIPQTLVDLAAKPLPSSDLFRSALLDTGLVDESQLDQWDLTPPYPISPSQQFSTLYVTNLIDVMHGRRLREYRRDETRRIARFHTSHLRTFRKSVSDLLAVEVEVWNQVQHWREGAGGLDEGGVHSIMANHFLQWTARRAKSLHEELEALKGGRDIYVSLMNSRLNCRSTI